MKIGLVFALTLFATSCGSLSSPQVIVDKTSKLHPDIWEGSMTGYFKFGYQFKIYPDQSQKGDCISGRFETSDVREGKVEKFQKFDGKKVTVFGRVEKSWEFVEDEINYITNVQNYCGNELVIVGENVVLLNEDHPK